MTSFWVYDVTVATHRTCIVCNHSIQNVHSPHDTASDDSGFQDISLPTKYRDRITKNLDTLLNDVDLKLILAKCREKGTVKPGIYDYPLVSVIMVGNGRRSLNTIQCTCKEQFFWSSVMLCVFPFRFRKKFITGSHVLEFVLIKHL